MAGVTHNGGRCPEVYTAVHGNRVGPDDSKVLNRSSMFATCAGLYGSNLLIDELSTPIRENDHLLSCRLLFKENWMDVVLIRDIAEIFTALGAILAGLLGIFKYFQYRTRRDKMVAVGEAFNSVVNSLATDAEVERLAAAIRLRRFFDPETEFGIVGTPYATEAVNVIAAVLRTQKTGSFQKLLADGLA
jgi:hypothetical protein